MKKREWKKTERERERQREKSKLFNRVFSIIIRQSICVRMQHRVIRGMEGGCRGWGWCRGRGGGFRESRSTIRKLWIYYLTGSFGSLRSDGASIMAGASLWAIFMRQNATHLNRAAGPKWGKKKKGRRKKRERREKVALTGEILVWKTRDLISGSRKKTPRNPQDLLVTGRAKFQRMGQQVGPMHQPSFCDWVNNFIKMKFYIIRGILKGN